MSRYEIVAQIPFYRVCDMPSGLPAYFEPGVLGGLTCPVLLDHDPGQRLASSCKLEDVEDRYCRVTAIVSDQTIAGNKLLRGIRRGAIDGVSPSGRLHGKRFERVRSIERVELREISFCHAAYFAAPIYMYKLQPEFRGCTY